MKPRRVVPAGIFRTSWVVDIRSRQAEMWRQPGKVLTASKLRDSTAVQAKPGPEPWLPIKPGRRSETITAMKDRWDRGAVNRHEYETYVGTLRATAALLGRDDPDNLRCLELALRVEDQARLSDDAFVAKQRADGRTRPSALPHSQA